LLQALSILRGVNVGAVVQLTVSKYSAPAGDDVMDSDSSTPVNMSANDIVSVATASVPGTYSDLLSLLLSLCMCWKLTFSSSTSFFKILYLRNQAAYFVTTCTFYRK